MASRLQIRLADEEMAQIRKMAKRESTSLSEWLRQAIRRASRQKASIDTEVKLGAVRKAVTHSHSTADIDQMNREIEQGYLK
jgi:hypothetical protein